MPALKGGPDKRYGQVDRTFGGLRVTPSPLGFGKTSANAVGALGHYTVAAATGTLAATLAADGLLFALRWTHATRKLVLLEFEASVIGLTPFDADQQMRLSLRRGTVYSGASSGGTDLASLVQKMDTAMAATSVADVRISSTAALTAGTVTAGGPIALALGTATDPNPADATEENIPVQARLHWKADVANGQHPLVLNASEGILLRNDILWGATGTNVVAVRARWAEVEDYMGVDGDS